jgi:hypothetical protein
VTEKKPPFPFMVFAESFDDMDDSGNRIGGNRIARYRAAREPRLGLATLLQARASPEEKDFRRSLDVVRRMAERDAKNKLRNEYRRHPKYAHVVADLVLDTKGRPTYRGHAHIALRHGVSASRVRKWITELRKKPAAPRSTWRYKWATTDWQTIYYGEALRKQQQDSGSQPKQPKS